MQRTTGLVLVHGAGRAADHWDLTVTELERQAPDLPVLAVNLPGRAGEPGDLATLTIADCVHSVLAQIDRAGLDRVVVAGHSQGGLVMPGVAQGLGVERLARLVFISAAVPPEGLSVVDALNPVFRAVSRRQAERGGTRPPPRAVATWLFCNGMTDEQLRFTFSRQHPDSSAVLLEPVHRALPPVPRTWVLLTRDRAVSPKTQRRYIENLGGVDEVVPLDTCHEALVSEPAALATILAARVP